MMTVEQWMEQNQKWTPEGAMAREFFEVFEGECSAENCHKFAQICMECGKEASAKAMSEEGFPCKTKTQDFNGCKCTVWTYMGRTVMVG
jgi:hypothetical protein